MCQRTKHGQQKRLGNMMSTKVLAPGQMWGVDLMGPLPASSQGNVYCLVAVDYFSKWVEICPLRRATSEAIARFLVKDVFSRFGFPEHLLSDNGPQFVSEIYRQTCTLFGINRKYISPYHPQTNLTERINRTLGVLMASYVDQRHGNWDRHLPELAFALRTAVSETTGFTPAKLFLGRELNTPWDAAMKLNVEQKIEKLDDLQGVVQRNVAKAQGRQKQYYDRHRRQVTFPTGARVWLRLHPLSSADRHQIAKFMPKWRGPCQVVRVVSPLVYELIDAVTQQRLGTHNVQDLKPYFERPERVEARPASPELDLESGGSSGTPRGELGASGSAPRPLPDSRGDLGASRRSLRRGMRVDYRRLAGLRNP